MQGEEQGVGKRRGQPVRAGTLPQRFAGCRCKDEQKTAEKPNEKINNADDAPLRQGISESVAAAPVIKERRQGGGKSPAGEDPHLAPEIPSLPASRTGDQRGAIATVPPAQSFKACRGANSFVFIAPTGDLVLAAVEFQCQFGRSSARAGGRCWKGRQNFPGMAATPRRAPQLHCHGEVCALRRR